MAKEYENILDRISRGDINESDIKSLRSGFADLLIKNQKFSSNNADMQNSIDFLNSKVSDLESELKILTIQRDACNIGMDSMTEKYENILEKEDGYKGAIKALAGML